MHSAAITAFTAYEWMALFGFLLISLLVDYFVVDRRPHEFQPRQAVLWVSVYVGAALVFGVYLSFAHGSEASTAFFSGYITEYLLSVDNLFVFLVLLTSFAVPSALSHYVLLIGVYLALLLRGLVIAAGAAAIHLFEPVLLIFAAVLVWTAIGIWRSNGAEPDPEGNGLVRWVSRRLPFHGDYRGRRYRVVVDGRKLFTPLLLVVIAIGTTGLLFALDSIPAVFGITTEPFIVFAVNAFALMGLRQLYFLLRGALTSLEHLGRGLAVILAFIAIKLVLEVLHGLGYAVPLIDTVLSLVVILLVLAATVFASWLHEKRHPGVAGEVGEEPAVAEPGEALEDLLGEDHA